MGVQDGSTAYEELRKKNIERNKKMMRSLGLLIPRADVQDQVKASGSRRRHQSLGDSGKKPRRSSRIADIFKMATMSSELQVSGTGESCRAIRHGKDERRKIGADGDCEQATNSKAEKGRASTMDKEKNVNMEEDISSSNSSESEDQIEFSSDGNDNDSLPKSKEGYASPQDDGQTTATARSLDSLKRMMPADFGTQFQEAVIRALMQSTGTVVGPSPSTGSPKEGGLWGGSVPSKADSSPPSTWDEGTYNRASARRKRRPPMTRTSAGEETDSQEEFPIPENESPQQKSLRTRRLNRSRLNKAKNLTNNRKAVKKLPYVIHVDGTGRAKGIHKHLWRAAVRGQCGCLDPTMDNIHHHPKHVVDSIWHALEKEWEFQGFAHRAREMFERSSTKYMRNQKMQLKVKCKKNKDNPKPGDVNPSHWAKIVELTKESSKQGMTSGSIHNTGDGSQRRPQVLVERNDQSLHLQESQRRSSSNRPKATNAMFSDEDTVESKIQSLRRGLLELENSRERRMCLTEEDARGKAVWKNKVRPIRDIKEEFDGRKENMVPDGVNGDLPSQVLLGSTTGRGGEEVDRKASYEATKKKAATAVEGAPQVSGSEGRQTVNAIEVECGDLVSLLSVKGGSNEEIGNAIVMGLASSKYARKVIPKGWHLVKVYTYTASGAAEVCPFPAGWAEQVKQKTVKDVEGRNILWPDSLLRF